jgi:hypothetical protein
MEGMEKQLTAVDWLVEKLKENGVNFWQEEIEMIEEAKQMEKVQIMKTWYDCKLSIIERNPTDAKQYYNKTFKSE